MSARAWLGVGTSVGFLQLCSFAWLGEGLEPRSSGSGGRGEDAALLPRKVNMRVVNLR